MDLGARSVRASQRPSRLVILGCPVAHSLSPVFQGAALQEAGLPIRYDREEVSPERLGDVLARLAGEGAGGNVTLPHKEAAASLIARRTPVAERVGAVNTFWTEHGALVGHNTDVDGVLATVRALFADDPAALPRVPVVLLGAGGSAAAVLVALRELGCRHVTVVARTPTRARALVQRLEIAVQVVPFEAVDVAVRGAGLVINATSIGLRDDALPASVRSISPACAVFDLVYRPGGTPWITSCREAGLRAEDGLRMLVEQGAAAFEVWFGQPAPREAMWRALGAAPPAHLPPPSPLR